ncbi:MAG: hypothetical protein JW894_08185 [Bacteroidales bacterium]|nr:hypothetical protein [Bacteroidales bacterium]
MIRRSVLLFFAALFSFNLHAQIIKTKLDVVGGISAREFLHIGLRYQYTDFTQLGIYYGGDIGIEDETIVTYAIDNMIHFGKHSFYSNRSVWYVRQGFTYVTSDETDRNRKFSYVNLSAGREFTVNDWLGFNADLGLIWQLMENVTYDASGTEPTYHNRWEWHPLARVQVFVSL